MNLVGVHTLTWAQVLHWLYTNFLPPLQVPDAGCFQALGPSHGSILALYQRAWKMTGVGTTPGGGGGKGWACIAMCGLSGGGMGGGGPVGGLGP